MTLSIHPGETFSDRDMPYPRNIGQLVAILTSVKVSHNSAIRSHPKASYSHP
ncbi:MAG: hypothetical protein AB1589_13405 [Cyanobacteriota bacterium]